MSKNNSKENKKKKIKFAIIAGKQMENFYYVQHAKMSIIVQKHVKPENGLNIKKCVLFKNKKE